MTIGMFWALAAIFIVVVTVAQEMRYRMQEIYSERYRAHKMRWILRRYPQLSHLTWKEIEAIFDTDQLYHGLRYD